jgi:DNA-binding NtrC family response regulator
MTTSTILIVDDEPDYLELLQGILHQEGYESVLTEKNPLNVLPILNEKNIDLIILDVYMPQLNGLELLEKVCFSHPKIPIVMVTAVDDIEIALKAIKLGAYEFITKPPDTDRLFLIIKRALEQKLLTVERDLLRTPVPKVEDLSSLSLWHAEKKKHFEDIITESQSMYKVFELAEIFAPTNETVLIIGETGTGKDLIARKIHELSSRRTKPFVVVNIASISSSLFESELFGHIKGSYTGATNDKVGYFESANGGTIFLDEIGELPKDLQGKLLRTIQYSEIYRIGSAKPFQLDIRIIAATNKDLMEAVNNNEFRADLYYRLNRGFIHLPPLRERRTDIKLLAEHFLQLGCKTYKKKIPGFSSEMLDALNTYSFPGNVRELENLVLNSVAKTKDYERIEIINFPKKIVLDNETITDERKLLTIEEAEEKHINFIMNHTHGNITKAAAILGISERTLQRKLKKIREK